VGHRPASCEVVGDGRVPVELAGAEGGGDGLHRLGSGAEGGGGSGVPVAQRDHGQRAALVQAAVQVEHVALNALLAGGQHRWVRRREVSSLVHRRPLWSWSGEEDDILLTHCRPLVHTE
jgi:hypothetical protein